MAGSSEVEKDADAQIRHCLEEGKSFLLDAGAGAGKTYSLVEALKFVLAARADELTRRGQHIACITFTNVAKDEIATRLNQNPLVIVSTIHDFLWTLIENHQKELRTAVLDFNDTLKDSSKRKVPRAELENTLPAVRISYVDKGTNLRKGRLFHDDLLSVARLMFDKHPRLSKITAAKYPLLFIDEYQDTSAAVVGIVLGVLLPLTKPALIVGLFGDKLQSIYGGSVHPGIGEIPADLRTNLQPIVKPDNRRCPTSVIDLLNHIRTDIHQVPTAGNPKGQALYISAEGLDAAEQFLKSNGWSLDPTRTKLLLLTHKLIGRKGGYFDLIDIYGDRGGFFRDDLLGGEDKTIGFFMDKVETLVAAWSSGRTGLALSVLKLNGFTLASIADKKRIREALDGLVEIRKKGTVRDVLTYLRSAKLFDIVDDLEERIDGNPPREESDDQTDDIYSEEEDKFYSALMELPYAQIMAFVEFLLQHTPFATKHGVKGAEFPDVIVVLDDAGAKWNMYSFDKYLSGEDESANLQRWLRTRNLFYVACSRPRERLAVVDLNKRSEAKIAKMKAWFGDEFVVEL